VAASVTWTAPGRFLERPTGVVRGEEQLDGVALVGFLRRRSRILHGHRLHARIRDVEEGVQTGADQPPVR